MTTSARARYAGYRPPTEIIGPCRVAVFPLPARAAHVIVNRGGTQN